MNFKNFEIYILMDALIAYKYQSNCPKNKIKIIQKKLLQMEDDLMTLTKEEMVFLRLIMRDAWYYCDVRNMDTTDRNHFNSIQKKLSQELINA